MTLAPCCLATLLLATQATPVVEEEWRLQRQEYESPQREDVHFWRLFSEISAVLMIGGVWYYLEVDLNRVDFIYDYDLPSLRDKYVYGEGFRFDDNAHWLNGPGHPLAGAASFYVARKNGFDPLSAAFTTGVHTLAWEITVEHREIVALNDLIWTPAGGLVLGEALFATTSYLRYTRRPFGVVVTGVLGTLDSFHSWLEGAPDPSHEHEHVLPFEARMPARVEIESGALVDRAAGTGTMTSARVGFSSRLYRVPGLFSPGRLRVLFTDTARAELSGDLSLGANEIRDYNLSAAVTIAGIAWQDIWRDDGGRPLGGGFLLALGADYSHHEHLGARLDRLSRSGLLQASLELYGTALGALGKLRLDLSPDFGSIAPRALDDPRVLETVRASSVIEKERYYWAYGVSASGRASASWGPLELEAGLAARAYESIDVLDRRQQAIVDVLHGSARRLEGSVGAGLEVPYLPLTLRARYQRRWQGDTLGQVGGEGEVELLSLTAHVPL